EAAQPATVALDRGERGSLVEPRIVEELDPGQLGRGDCGNVVSGIHCALRSRNVGAVTGQAHLGVLALEPGRVEPGTVGAEPASSQGRVTGQAIPLHVAGDAALEVLPGRLTVTGEEEALGVVEAIRA